MRPAPPPALPTGFHRLIAAQFCSALADNALLIVAMAALRERQLPGWWAPLLKVGFNLAYVLLAPWVGPLADRGPKARWMGWMNGLKLLGVLGLAAGAHPVLAMAVVGVGAAAYAPAKYGLVTELVDARGLVRANGWIEVSVVAAVLLGTALGGGLVAPAWLQAAGGAWSAVLGLAMPLNALAPAVSAAPAGPAAPSALGPSLAVLGLVYAAAGVLNRGLPDSGARYPRAAAHPLALLRGFARDQRTLWRDADGALSMAATTVFWGVGATLQFMVLRWAQDTLGMDLSQAALLQAVVAVGVVAGAAAAGRWVPMARAHQMLGFGVALGLALPLLAQVHSLAWALPLLLAAGALGGLMVVPLNALLQHRGVQLMSAGRSIAVQGFNENASILAMLAAYAALSAAGLDLTRMMVGFGLLVAAALMRLAWRSAARPPGPRADPAPR